MHGKEQMNGLFPIATPVRLKDSGATGLVCGHAFQHNVKETRSIYLVSLTQGFWNERKDTYVSVLVVHPDNLERIV